jgi:hypothetical protein
MSVELRDGSGILARMTFDESLAALPWRRRVVLRKIAEEGATFPEAAAAAGIDRRAVTYWREDPAFDALVRQARDFGAEKRTHLLWLRHYRRGMRPPTGKGHGGKPRFCWGR